jgi:hypothetical protein
MAKKRTSPPPAEAPKPPARSFTVWRIAAFVAALAAIGLVVVAFQRETPAGTGMTESSQASTPAAAPSSQTAPAPQATETPKWAALGPRTQMKLPPLPFTPTPPAAPLDVLSSVYRFAAEHPEILSYVPCYCGCERGGHRGSEDCFVTARAANGDVTEWEPHGMT